MLVDERTHLRLLDEGDAKELFALVEANREYLRPWMPWAADGDPQATLDFVRACKSNLAERRSAELAVIHDDTIVGFVGINRPDWPNLVISMGYWIAADRQGRGLVTGAAARLIRFAFEEWGLHRIEIRADVANTRSRAVAERLGFQQEGVLREAGFVDGRFVDYVLFGLVAA